MSRIGLLLLALAVSGMLGCTGANPLRAVRDRHLLHEPAPVKKAVDPTIDVGPPPIDVVPDLVPLMGVDPGLNQNRQLTLAEALQISMRNSDIVRVGDGGDVSIAPNSTYDPAIAAAQVDAALAAFDTSFGATFASTRINQPPNSFFGPGLVEPVRRDEMVFTAGLNKRLITGGEARIAFNPTPGYLFLPLGTTSFYNPQYVGDLEMTFRQPLLRGAGTEVTGAPVRISQLRMEQSAWDFKKMVMENLRGVAEAYYELEAARVAVQAIDDVLPLLVEMVHLQEENYKAKWVIQAEVAKAHAQLHLYRQQRAQLESAVVERELRLRNLMRLPPRDGWNMIPATSANRAPLTFDPADALSTAYGNHPDLLRQQLSVRIREVERRVAQNGLLPQFDFQAMYRLNGVGQNLGDMLEQLSTATYGDWMLGGSFSMPVGRRQARAEARAAELQVAKERELLRQEALSAAHRIGESARQIRYTYEQYDEAAARLRAAEDWLKGSRLRYQNPLPADDGQNWLLVSLNDYLSAVRFRTDAATDAAALLARYNGQLIRLEEAKGTLLAYFDFVLVDDPCGLIRVAPASYMPPLFPPSLPPVGPRDIHPLPPTHEIVPLPEIDGPRPNPQPLIPPQPLEPAAPAPRPSLRRLPNIAQETILEAPKIADTAMPKPATPPAPQRLENEVSRQAMRNTPSPPPQAGSTRLATPRPDNRYPVPTQVEADEYWVPQMPPLFYAR